LKKKTNLVPQIFRDDDSLGHGTAGAELAARSAEPADPSAAARPSPVAAAAAAVSCPPAAAAAVSRPPAVAVSRPPVVAVSCPPAAAYCVATVAAAAAADVRSGSTGRPVHKYNNNMYKCCSRRVERRTTDARPKSRKRIRFLESHVSSLRINN